MDSTVILAIVAASSAILGAAIAHVGAHSIARARMDEDRRIRESSDRKALLRELLDLTVQTQGDAIVIHTCKGPLCGEVVNELAPTFHRVFARCTAIGMTTGDEDIKKRIRDSQVALAAFAAASENHKMTAEESKAAIAPVFKCNNDLWTVLGEKMREA